MLIRVLFLAILSFTAIMQAVEGGQINYRGTLINSAGRPVPDSSYQVKFAIYDDQLGGNNLWQSSGYTTVATSGGNFECLLGSTNPLPDSLAKFTDLWLGISFQDGEEIKPRTTISYNELPASLPAEDNYSEPVLSLDPNYISSEKDQSARIPAPDTTENKPKLRWFVAKAGWDLGGNYQAGPHYTYNVSQGLTMALEVDGSDNPGIGLFGLGVEFEAPRSHESTDGSFGYVSFYATGKFKPFHFSSESDFLIISGKGGCGLVYGNEQFRGSNSTEAGLYYAAGAGLVLEDAVIIEVMYTVNQQGFSLGGDDADTKYSRINISLGMNFRQKK